MDAQGAMLRGRTAAEALMVDACTITRVTDETTDPETGQITPITAPVYSGKCRVQDNSRLARPTTIGEAYVFQSAYVLQLPVVGSEGVQVGDQVLITTSSNDGDLLNRPFWVRELAHKTHATARRLGVEEVTS